MNVDELKRRKQDMIEQINEIIIAFQKDNSVLAEDIEHTHYTYAGMEEVLVIDDIVVRI